MTRVAILGCGPAGLVAAHAAEKAGAHVEIFSKRRKSHMFGAQYLHEPIPGIDPGEPQEIRYLLEGSADDYRRKVYGHTYDGETSPEVMEENQTVYDIRHTYDQLWERFGKDVYHTDITSQSSWILDMKVGVKFDNIISTIPMDILCANRYHRFSYQGIWAYGDAPDLGQYVDPEYAIPDGTVLCNGNEFPTWYRASRIFGHATFEWSQQGTVPRLPVAEVKKPIETNCDCWPKVTRIGRYGQWQKGVLVHHVYADTLKALEA